MPTDQRGSERTGSVVLWEFEWTSRRRWAAIGSSLQWTQAIRRMGETRGVTGLRMVGFLIEGGLVAEDEARVAEERRDGLEERGAAHAARGRDERGWSAEHDQGRVRLAAPTVREPGEPGEGGGMEAPVQLERDEREGAGAQRDVGRDVGLGRVFGADDDEAPLEIEELAWVVGAVGVDEEGG
ncbi:MAG: hypothetical protein JNM07_14910, partial [Phycisphaerae bacterium]|nr:hypothetical protein [Phycisphaerae bacterium]